MHRRKHGHTQWYEPPQLLLVNFTHLGQRFCRTTLSSSVAGALEDGYFWPLSSKAQRHCASEAFCCDVVAPVCVVAGGLVPLPGDGGHGARLHITGTSVLVPRVMRVVWAWLDGCALALTMKESRQALSCWTMSCVLKISVARSETPRASVGAKTVQLFLEFGEKLLNVDVNWVHKDCRSTIGCIQVLVLPRAGSCGCLSGFGDSRWRVIFCPCFFVAKEIGVCVDFFRDLGDAAGVVKSSRLLWRHHDCSPDGRSL